jgi:hypothetical protein
MRNTFPHGFFKILLNIMSDLVVVRKFSICLWGDYQLFVLLS